jgi:hypothetical protein
MRTWWNGRHRRLKISRSKEHRGSTPLVRTILGGNMKCHFCGKNLCSKDAYVLTKTFLPGDSFGEGWWNDEEKVADYFICDTCNDQLVESFKDIERRMSNVQ